METAQKSTRASSLLEKVFGKSGVTSSSNKALKRRPTLRHFLADCDSRRRRSQQLQSQHQQQPFGAFSTLLFGQRDSLVNNFRLKQKYWGRVRSSSVLSDEITTDNDAERGSQTDFAASEKEENDENDDESACASSEHRLKRGCAFQPRSLEGLSARERELALEKEFSRVRQTTLRNERRARFKKRVRQLRRSQKARNSESSGVAPTSPFARDCGGRRAKSTKTMAGNASTDDEGVDATFAFNANPLHQRRGAFSQAELNTLERFEKTFMISEIMASGANQQQIDAEIRICCVIQVKMWPIENKVPLSTSSLLDLIRMTRAWRKRAPDRPEGKPIIVMSHNGVSRCGIFIGANVCIDQMDMDHEVDVFHAVKMIRLNRPQLIDMKDEYKYLYDLMLHWYMNNPEYRVYEPPEKSSSPRDFDDDNEEGVDDLYYGDNDGGAEENDENIAAAGSRLTRSCSSSRRRRQKSSRNVSARSPMQKSTSSGKSTSVGAPSRSSSGKKETVYLN